VLVSWDTTGIWVILALGCAVAVIRATRTRSSAAERPRFRQAPLAFLQTYADAVMTGLALGIVAVGLIMVVAAGFNAVGI
jgi:hypothetical protein